MYKVIDLPTVRPTIRDIAAFERKHVPGGIVYHQLRQILTSIDSNSKIIARIPELIERARKMHSLTSFMQRLDSEVQEEILKLIAWNIVNFYEEPEELEEWDDNSIEYLDEY